MSSDAIARLEARFDSFESRLFPAKKQGITFGELWEKFRKTKFAETADARWQPKGVYAKRAIPVLAYFDVWPADTIDRMAWTEYRAERMQMPGKDHGKTLSPLTVALEVDWVKQAYRWAKDVGLIPDNPMDKVKRAAGEPNSQAAMREEDLDLVLAHCQNDHARAHFLVGLHAGPRRFEIQNIIWANINPETREILLTRTKGRKPRVIVLSTRALEALLALPRIPGCPFVFAYEKDGNWHQYHTYTLGEWVRKAVIASGIEVNYDGKKVRSHGLRHGYATNADERGVRLRAIQHQLGHSSLAITEKYLHARRGELQEAARVFEDGLKSMKRKGPRPSASQDAGSEKNDVAAQS